MARKSTIKLPVNMGRERVVVSELLSWKLTYILWHAQLFSMVFLKIRNMCKVISKYLPTAFALVCLYGKCGLFDCLYVLL